MPAATITYRRPVNTIATNALRAVAVLACAAALTACGGGSSSPPAGPPAPTPTPTATPIPSGTITEFSVPAALAVTNLDVATLGPDGNVWFSDFANPRVVKVTPAGVVTAYPLAGAHAPYGIAVGADGNLWVCDDGAGSYFIVNPTTGVASSFALGGMSSLKLNTKGPDNAMWFTAFASSGGQSYVVSFSGGTFNQYVIPDVGYGIAVGPDSRLWFTTPGTATIRAITTSGALSAYPITTNPSAEPFGIVAGSDGAMWFADANPASAGIGRITTSGTITEYATPTHGTEIVSLTLGPDHNIWFAEIEAARIGKITPTGTITEYPLATGSAPIAIAAGADGGIWFAEDGTNKIGRIQP